MNNNLTKENILQFLRIHWRFIIPIGIAIVILVIVIIIQVKPIRKNIPVSPGYSTPGTISPTSPTKKPLNPFSIFSNKKAEPTIPMIQAIDSSLKNIHSGNPAASIPKGIIKILPNGSRTIIPIGGSATIQTAQGTINPQSNIQTGVDSNTQVDSIRVVFKNPDGTTTTYIPPGTPPGEVRWGRYTNNRDKYALNYPVNWQFIFSIDADGHEGVALYPPGVDSNNPNSPYIGFGLSESFHLPAADNSVNAYVTKIKIDGVDGDLYTDGPLGNSYIASVLRYSNKYFGLGSRISDPTFAYVYYYMLYSLTFNIP